MNIRSFLLVALPVAGSAWADQASCPPPVGSVTINDTDASIIYSTMWNYRGDHEDFRGDEHYSKFQFSRAYDSSGAALVVNFTGTGIAWGGKKGPNFGIAAYSVDGAPRQLVDNYSPSLMPQTVNLGVSGLSPGAHALKIEATPTKNGSSSNYYQVVDSFLIEGAALPPTSGVVAGYNSPAVIYSAGWTCGANSEDLSGGHCWSNVTNASLSWNFTGSLVEMFGRPDTENGIFNVLIDGVQVATVDGHFYNQDIDILNSYPEFIARVTPGSHTIQLVNTGAHNPDSTGTFLQFDQFLAFQ